MEFMERTVSERGSAQARYGVVCDRSTCRHSAKYHDHGPVENWSCKVCGCPSYVLDLIGAPDRGSAPAPEKGKPKKKQRRTPEEWGEEVNRRLDSRCPDTCPGAKDARYKFNCWGCTRDVVAAVVRSVRRAGAEATR